MWPESWLGFNVVKILLKNSFGKTEFKTLLENFYKLSVFNFELGVSWLNLAGGVIRG